jgi:hypothetical protein
MAEAQRREDILVVGQFDDVAASLPRQMAA